MRSLWLHVSFSVDGNDGWMIEIIQFFIDAQDTRSIAFHIHIVNQMFMQEGVLWVCPA
jgi:hypothetical protein